MQLLRATVRFENVPSQRAEHRDRHKRLVANIGRARCTGRRGHRHLGVEVAIVGRRHAGALEGQGAGGP